MPVEKSLKNSTEPASKTEDFIQELATQFSSGKPLSETRSLTQIWEERAKRQENTSFQEKLKQETQDQRSNVKGG